MKQNISWNCTTNTRLSNFFSLFWYSYSGDYNSGYNGGYDYSYGLSFSTNDLTKYWKKNFKEYKELSYFIHYIPCNLCFWIYNDGSGSRNRFFGNNRNYIISYHKICQKFRKSLSISPWTHFFMAQLGLPDPSHR